MSTSSRHHGYTLLELLIIVTLLGLAGSLLIPYMTSRSSLETQAAVRMVIVDLNFAQSDALANQEFRRVHFFEDGSGYAIVRVTQANFDEEFDPDTADYLYDPLGRSGSLQRYITDFTADNRFEGVTIGEVAIDGTNRYITYDHLGGTVRAGGSSPGIGGSIIVTSDEATYRINIAPFTGKLTVEQID
jgi:type II secretory pathway pseudopilin PulG